MRNLNISIIYLILGRRQININIQYRRNQNRYKKQVIYQLNYQVILLNQENCAVNRLKRAVLGGPTRAPRAGAGCRWLPYGLGQAGCAEVQLSISSSDIHNNRNSYMWLEPQLQDKNKDQCSQVRKFPLNIYARTYNNLRIRVKSNILPHSLHTFINHLTFPGFSLTNGQRIQQCRARVDKTRLSLSVANRPKRH